MIDAKTKSPFRKHCPDLVQDISVVLEKLESHNVPHAGGANYSGMATMESPDQDMLDIEYALKNTDRSTEMLLRLYRLFVNELDESLDSIFRNETINDMDSVTWMIHVLKGTSATIGAMQVSKICTDIHREAGKEAIKYLDAFNFRLKPVLVATLRQMALLVTPDTHVA